MDTIPDTAGAETAGETALVPYLLSIAKTMRQLVGIKLAECDVVPGQDRFLLCFDGRKPRTVADIAACLSVRASTISKMTDILSRKGWVERQVHDADARKVLVRLTEAGWRVREEVAAIEARLDQELWSLIGKNAAILPALAKLDDVLAKRLSRLR